MVTKLFHIVEPDAAFFGRKDYQQWRVVQRMARDLDMAVEVVGMPVVREADGLAMSRQGHGACVGAKGQCRERSRCVVGRPGCSAPRGTLLLPGEQGAELRACVLADVCALSCSHAVVTF